MAVASVADHEIVEGAGGPHLVCHASTNAPCHRRCPTGTCESWGLGSCRCGPLVADPGCLAVDWIEAVGLDDSAMEISPDTFDEDGILHYRGPVDVEYDPDAGYRWLLPEVDDVPDHEEEAALYGQ